MKPIGGYFELELPARRNVLHKNGLFLSSGRSAIEYILKANNVKHIYIPKFTCKVILEPIERNAVKYDFYNIDENLEIAENIDTTDRSTILYTNYFGIKDGYIRHNTLIFKRLTGGGIIDNAQALFSKPISGLNTAYSPRKFAGLPDGGIVFSNSTLNQKLEKATSFGRCTHLLKRLELIPSEGYQDFRDDEAQLRGQDIQEMSTLSKKIYDSIDFGRILKIRKKNFAHLHSRLETTNLLSIPKLDSFACPMVYPYLVDNGCELKIKLISKDVFVATYWPNVFDWCKSDEYEYYLANNLIPIPIDQRYDISDMDRILDIILQ